MFGKEFDDDFYNSSYDFNTIIYLDDEDEFGYPADDLYLEDEFMEAFGYSDGCEID